MRSGEVPVLVALPYTEETAVAYIDGDEQLLTSLDRDGTLAEDHRICAASIDRRVCGSSAKSWNMNWMLLIFFEMW